ncbi:inner membrane protein YbjM, partial [Enterobacter asburiae]
VYLIEISQEDSLNIKRNWAGVISCFLLFTVVWMLLAFKLNAGFKSAGHPDLGVLIFYHPGAGPTFIYRKRELVNPCVL